MNRMRVRRRKDKRVFSRTAAKTKAINVRPGEWRGGIRL
uniref:Uncharacterized protein n=1 Tax=Dulem virus 172 TaxID=3145649 RepID=A0AAU8AWW7_9VIRU